MKKVIRLTEQDLHRIVRQSVQEAVDEGLWGRLTGGIKGAGNAIRGEFNKAKQGAMQTGLGNEYAGQSFGSRMKAAKNMVKAQANQGDSAQELNNLKNTLYKMELNGYFNKAVQPIADKLYKALEAQVQSGENLGVKGAYKRGYGQSMPQNQAQSNGMGYSRRNSSVTPGYAGAGV